MITGARNFIHKNSWDKVQDCSLGNILFIIAGTIGIAIKNGYEYGFFEWDNQKYFVNPLPKINPQKFPMFYLKRNYKQYDIGYQEVKPPDNVELFGYMGSPKYFEHCEDLIRHYFTMKKICEPYKDTILMHYRNYNLKEYHNLTDYYTEALKHLPEKKIIVVTDNIDAARKSIGINCEYISNSPIEDFYILSQADYLVIGNSTFSWWGAWLSNAKKIIAPNHWFSESGSFSDAPLDLNELYLDNWIKI